MKNQNPNIIAVLSECADACNNCSTACLEEKDVQKMSACIKLDMDCAQICAVTAAFISRGSDHAKHLLKECAEICRKCAEECAKHEMEHCQKCAEACKKCSQECSKALA